MENFILQVWLAHNQLGLAAQKLQALPARLRPTSHCQDELGPSTNIVWGPEFESDFISSRISIMKSPEATYDLSYWNDDYNVLSVGFSDERIGIDLSTHLFFPGIHYGYCCRVSEREALNCIFVPRENGIFRGWVGRNFDEYLPGLYWISCISNDLIQKHRLKIDSNLYSYDNSVFTRKDSYFLVDEPTDTSSGKIFEIKSVYDLVTPDMNTLQLAEVIRQFP